MEQFKSIFASKTFWTSVVGVLTTIPFVSKYFTGADPTGIADGLAALSPVLFALAAAFRGVATTQVVMGTPSTAKSMNEAKATGLMGNPRRSGSAYSVMFLILLIPLLGGCNQTTAAVVVPSPGATKVDVAIGNASQQVAQYCSALRFGIGIGQMLAKTETHKLYVARAVVVVQTYCDNPFVDAAGALDFLATAYRNIMTVPAVRAEVRASKLRPL